MNIRSLGIAVAILGLLMMVYTGFTYITTKLMADLGALKIDKEEKRPVQWSPIIGSPAVYRRGLFLSSPTAIK